MNAPDTIPAGEPTRANGAGAPEPVLPGILARAFAPEEPADPVPPGPRVNPWHRCTAPVPGGPPTASLPSAPAQLPLGDPAGVRWSRGLRDLLWGLWRSPGFHRAADGSPTRVRRRPVPSAGGTFPVQTHVVVGVDSTLGLVPGRYVYDHERDVLVGRGADRVPVPPTDPDTALVGSLPAPTGSRAAPDAAGAATGPVMVPPATGASDSWLVFTVQPGRSAGRYRHRAWPLWIADTAYALTAAEFLLREPVETITGPGDALRELLGVPPAHDTARWLAHGLVPEIPLSALRLPSRVRVDHGRARALAARRSPAPDEFLARVPGTTDGHARELARHCRQAWVAGADRVRSWSVPTGAPPALMARTLWGAHRAGAWTVYDAALSGRGRCRPVSGFTAVDGTWTVHAVAVLESHLPAADWAAAGDPRAAGGTGSTTHEERTP